MSGQFFWKVVAPPSDKPIGPGISSDVQKLESVFGSFPKQFDETTVPTLMAMHIACGQTQSIYGAIASLVSTHGPIEVKWEW